MTDDDDRMELVIRLDRADYDLHKHEIDKMLERLKELIRGGPEDGRDAIPEGCLDRC